MQIFVIKKSRLVLWALVIIFLVLISATAIYANGAYSMKSSKESGIKVPIIMYHSVLKDKSKTNKYIITPESLENDFAYLKNNGYKTILISDLINYVYDNQPLPDKCVIITFDDGYLNNMKYAVPLLNKYDFKAVISVVGIYADTFTKSCDKNPNYAYLSWEDIGTLLETERIEFGNHTYDLHSTGIRKGCQKLKSESSQHYKEMLTYDISELQDKYKDSFGIAPVVFTYPFGYISRESISVVKQIGFKASLSCSEKVNIITKQPECLFLLGRFNRDGKISTAKFMQKIIY